MKYFEIVCIFFLVLSCSTIKNGNIPLAVINFSSNSFYIDSKHSEIDESLKKKNEESVRPLRNFTNSIAKNADLYRIDKVRNYNKANEVLLWLKSWSKQGAMLGIMANEQAFYERKWFLASVGLTYAKVREISDHETDEIILNWLSKLAEKVIEHSKNFKGIRNNHYYWEGLAVVIVGRLTNNQNFLEFGKNVFLDAEKEIDEVGILKQEIKRGSRAFHYHVYAAAPLVLIGSLLDLNSDKLNRLVDFIIKNIADPKIIETKTGEKQIEITDSNFAWLEVYNRRIHSDLIEKFLIKRRPLIYNGLGGNLSIKGQLEK